MNYRDRHVRFLRVNGVTTRYLEAGDPDRPTVYLLHDGAWGGCSDVTWASCLPILAEQFHIIAPDFVGFGGSDKLVYFDRPGYAPRIAQLEALFDAHVVSAPHVVGSSYGGSVALRMLVESRFPLKSVVSIGGTGGLWKRPSAFGELGHWDGTITDLARVVSLLMDESNAGFDDHLSLRYRWAKAPGHYRAVASASLSLPASLEKTTSDDRWPTVLGKAHTPTLLVAGDGDTLFEPQWPEHIQAEFPAAEIRRVAGTHSPNLDHPEAISDLIADFVLGVENDSGQ